MSAAIATRVPSKCSRNAFLCSTSPRAFVNATLKDNQSAEPYVIVLTFLYGSICPHVTQLVVARRAIRVWPRSRCESRSNPGPLLASSRRIFSHQGWTSATARIQDRIELQSSILVRSQSAGRSHHFTRRRWGAFFNRLTAAATDGLHKMN